MNTLALLPLCASGLVTVTVLTPVAAAAPMVMLAVRLVAEPKAHELTVTPTPKLQVAPVTNCVPVMTVLSVCPCTPELGATAVTVGGGNTKAVTVNPATSVPACTSGFVTVTVRVPTVAVPLMVMFAVSDVAEVNVQELVVTPVPKPQVAPD